MGIILLLQMRNRNIKIALLPQFMIHDMVINKLRQTMSSSHLNTIINHYLQRSLLLSPLDLHRKLLTSR
ncbi:hypothetical protein V1478_010757 [Vespula squamosa]|uniref:Uncharacterized protein n=1 Tax=Vespula squamosa TaxID=30214 RepID=A0ABD2AFI9_VESSQ